MESAPDSHPSPQPSEPEISTTTARRPKYGPPRIPTANSLDDVLRYWEDGAPDKGLVVPLANWCINFKPHEYRNEAQKYSLMGILRDEFVIHCNGDWDVFESRYPDLRHSYTKLIVAVREARIARGETKPRRRQR